MASLDRICTQLARKFFGSALPDSFEPFFLLTWKGGHPWAAANIWARHLARKGNSRDEVYACMTHLTRYAQFLERIGLAWDYFEQDVLTHAPSRLWLHIDRQLAAAPEEESLFGQYLQTVFAFYWFVAKLNHPWIDDALQTSMATTLTTLEGLPFHFGIGDGLCASTRRSTCVESPTSPSISPLTRNDIEGSHGNR